MNLTFLETLQLKQQNKGTSTGQNWIDGSETIASYSLGLSQISL